MKAEDLRFKNLVQRNGTMFMVNDIHGASGLVTMFPGDGGDWHGRRAIQDYEPIPLTDKALENLGFAPNKQRYRTYPTSIDPNKKCYAWGICEHIVLENMPDSPPTVNIKYYDFDGNSQTESIRKIEYVHQLQNLFFALTGSELEIKQPA